MLTRQQRTRKHFSHLCPFGKPLKISILASKEMPTEARKFKAGGWKQGQAFFRGGVGVTRAETPQAEGDKVFPLTPKIPWQERWRSARTRGCGWSRSVSGTPRSSLQRETGQETQENYPLQGLELRQHSEPMVQPGGFYPAASGKHASESAVGKINHEQTV